MASFNKITIVGYLGKDPEIKYLTSGDGICSFSVATTERKKDKSGDYQDSTLWFRVNVWGKQGEACNQYLSKGSQVYVCGRLSQQTYTDRDGNVRTSLDVRADDVQFLTTSGEGQQKSESQPTRTASKPKAQHEVQGFGDDDDSAPF